MHGKRSISEVRSALALHGIRTAYVKLLSSRQDNDKNQIYFGKRLPGLLNLFPARLAARGPSSSIAKAGSRSGQPLMEAALDFAWLDEVGNRHDAPGTRIIDYFQYPEVRMSGFLKGCDDPPDALRRSKQAFYGRRILVMGTARDGKVLGLVLSERDDPVVSNFPELPLQGDSGVLRVLIVDADTTASPAELLHQEIAAVVHGGWHASRILKAGGIEPFRAAQGGGYTLEALLGVAANGDKKPDKHGFEIKSFTGSRISLMTPTPDYGYQGKHSFREFMQRYGKPGQKDDGSLRFTGIHRCDRISQSTGLGMRVIGYDAQSDTFGDPAEVGVELFDPQTGTIAAGWSLDKLANCWNEKHANALYIRAERRESADGYDYRYSNSYLTGTGTDVWKLLRAIARGLVFYDPADTIYADGMPKVRSQWRLNAAQLPQAMQALYASAETVTV